MVASASRLSNRRHAVRRGLPMHPMAGRQAETGDPMHREGKCARRERSIGLAKNIEAARIIAPRIMFLSMRYRVLIAVLGLVVAFVGLVAWSIEGEYGSGTDFLVQTHQGGPAIVYEVDEEKGTRTQVFEGPRREAQAYMERRRSEGENFLISTLIILLERSLWWWLWFRWGGRRSTRNGLLRRVQVYTAGSPCSATEARNVSSGTDGRPGTPD